MDIGTGNSLIVLLILAVVSVVCPVLVGVLLLLLGTFNGRRCFWNKTV